MGSKPMECGSMGMMMGNANAEKQLCDPLERLKLEHRELRGMMEEFHNIAESIANGSGEDKQDQLQLLLQRVVSFNDKLEVHSLKEDDTLFPFIARYIGREVGPVAVMEYEHEQARLHLRRFIEDCTVADAMDAYSLLSMHFTKEDNILFPMADHMLSEEEKAQLDARV